MTALSNRCIGLGDDARYARIFAGPSALAVSLAGIIALANVDGPRAQVAAMPHLSRPRRWPNLPNLLGFGSDCN